jgi:hypothetical protein
MAASLPPQRGMKKALRAGIRIAREQMSARKADMAR